MEGFYSTAATNGNGRIAVMPKELEKKLKQEAKKKFPVDKKKQDRYVYGALRKTGWKPKKK